MPSRSSRSRPGLLHLLQRADRLGFSYCHAAHSPVGPLGRTHSNGWACGRGPGAARRMTSASIARLDRRRVRADSVRGADGRANHERRDRVGSRRRAGARGRRPPQRACQARPRRPPDWPSPTTPRARATSAVPPSARGARRELDGRSPRPAAGARSASIEWTTSSEDARGRPAEPLGAASRDARLASAFADRRAQPAGRPSEPPRRRRARAASTTADAATFDTLDRAHETPRRSSAVDALAETATAMNARTGRASPSGIAKSWQPDRRRTTREERRRPRGVIARRQLRSPANDPARAQPAASRDMSLGARRLDRARAPL